MIISSDYPPLTADKKHTIEMLAYTIVVAYQWWRSPALSILRHRRFSPFVTASPIQNSLRELWSLLSFANASTILWTKSMPMPVLSLSDTFKTVQNRSGCMVKRWFPSKFGRNHFRTNSCGVKLQGCGASGCTFCLQLTGELRAMVRRELIGTQRRKSQICI